MKAEQSAGQAVKVVEWPGALTAARGVGLKDWQLTVVEVVKDGSNCLLDNGISDDSHSIKRQLNSSKRWTGQDEDRGLQVNKVKRLDRAREVTLLSRRVLKSCQILKSQYLCLSGSCTVNCNPEPR